MVFVIGTGNQDSTIRTFAKICGAFLRMLLEIRGMKGGPTIANNFGIQAFIPVF
jgi:hypothetical protein